MPTTALAPDPLELGPRLVALAAEQGVTARLIGGVAIALHTPGIDVGPFAREYEDVDLVVDSAGRRELDAVLERAGCTPDTAFNTVNGRERRAYYGAGDRKVDVFIGSFQMCHTLPLEQRLGADAPTVPLAELLLSKTQIYELNRKDAGDLLALLHGHALGAGDDDVINATRLGELTGQDWGLWRTTRRSLRTLRGLLDDVGLDAARRATVAERIDAVERVLDDAPKSLKWKARNRVGDRVPWYELPEDPERGEG